MSHFDSVRRPDDSSFEAAQLQARLSERASECFRLREELKGNAAIIVAAESTIEELRVSLANSRVEGERFRLELSQAEREIEQRDEELALQSQMLEDKNRTILNYHSTSSARIAELEEENSDLQFQLRQAQNDLEVSLESAAERSRKIHDNAATILSLERRLSELQDQHERELQVVLKARESENYNMNAFLQNTISELQDKHEIEIETLRREASARQQALEQALQALEMDRDQLEAKVSGYESTLEIMDELNSEDKLKQELLLLSKNIESSTQRLASKEFECNLLLDSVQHLKNTNELLNSENETLKNGIRMLEASERDFQSEVSILNKQNKDLCKQLQNLLRKPNGAIGPNDTDIHVNLVVYEDISDLQEKNAELLKVVHGLNEDLKRFKRHNVADAESVREVEELRNARQKMEEMVKKFVGETNFNKYNDESFNTDYRSDQKELTIRDSSSVVRRSTSSSQGSISQAEKEKINQLTLSTIKLEESNKLLNESLGQARSEISQLSVKLEEAVLNANAYKDKYSSMEKTLRQVESKVRDTSQEVQVKQSEILNLQRDINDRNVQIQKLSVSLKNLEEVSKRKEVELQVSKKMEAELISQLQSLKHSMSFKEQQLYSAVNEIQANLTSKSADEYKNLLLEREALLTTIDGLRKEISEKEILDDRKQKNFTEDIRVLRSKYDSVLSQLASTREDLTREQTSSTVLKDKFNLMEKQLLLAENKLKQYQSNSASTLEGSNSSLDEQTIAQIEHLKRQVLLADSQTERYKQLFVVSEANIKDLNENFAKKSLEFETSQQKLNDEINHLTQNLTSSISENDTLRESAAAMEKELQSEIQNLRDEIESLLGGSLSQIEALKSDAIRFQHLAKVTHANYEKEFDLRVNLENSLATAQESLDSVKSQLSVAEKALRDSQSECDMKEKLRIDAESIVDGLRNESKKKISELTQINDILHSQMQTLSRQLQKLEESRPDVLPGSVSDEVMNELIENRTTITELREVLRYLKREREMLDAKLGVSESESKRHFSSLQAALRTIDELRTELKREIDKNSLARSEEEFARLMGEVNKLNNISEENFKLKFEIDDLKNKLAASETEVSKLSEKLRPVNDIINSLNAKIEALKLEISTLKEENKAFKDRLQQLMERYRDVDPVEHSNLKLENQKLAETIKTLEASVQSVGEEVGEKWREKLRKLKADFVSKLEVARAECESSKLALSTKVEEYESKLDAARSETEVTKKLLSSKVDELNTCINESKLSTVTLTSQIDSLKDQLQTSNAKNVEMTEKVEALQKQVAKHKLLSNLSKRKTESASDEPSQKLSKTEEKEE